MTESNWIDKRKRLPWQTMLTADERTELARMDFEIARLRKRLGELIPARRLIQNRAVQRYRYDEGAR
jgi:hypothetical protein